MSAAEANPPSVRTLAEIGWNDRQSVGGKGASLGELTAAGVPVPRGFVVTTGHFERFMRAVDPNHLLRVAIEQLDGDDLHAIASLTHDLGQRIKHATLPDRTRDAIVAAYRSLVGGDVDSPVAIRSSATSEDSADASFAGLHDTYLWVRDEADDAAVNSLLLGESLQQGVRELPSTPETSRARRRDGRGRSAHG